MNSNKCQNCKVTNPQIKKQGTTKLFCVWSSRKALLDNAKEGFNIVNVLERGRDDVSNVTVIARAACDRLCTVRSNGSC